MATLDRTGVKLARPTDALGGVVDRLLPVREPPCRSSETAKPLGSTGVVIANAAAWALDWVAEVCARAVYIGDNSKLFLESAEPSART